MSTAHTFYGYIRISTLKQGEGVSLEAQRDSISSYAERNGLRIGEWFEEKETAAKRGRPVFAQMLNNLKRQLARGVVIHKIDRSARNLRDWADLGELIDHGIDVHFANESLDLHSRGGRLSADIQAVVAADYIRNLREETRKGFYGRISQGLYPLPAPLGYLDMGKGKPKKIDPQRGPLVRKAFSLYASGGFSLLTLVDELSSMGLRNRNGGPITRTGLSVILNNPFYMGMIRLRKTGELYKGAHPALVDKDLFDRVREKLTGRTAQRPRSHAFLFRRLLECATCGIRLTGELQKSHVYYRCHTRACSGASVREEQVERAVHRLLEPLRFNSEERHYLDRKISRLKETWRGEMESNHKLIGVRIGKLNERLSRLTDAYLDRVLERHLFEERKREILLTQKDLEDQQSRMERGLDSVPDLVAKYFELAGDALFLWKSGIHDEKRELLEIVTSNRRVRGKNLDFMLSQPFYEVANRRTVSSGAPFQDTVRTFDRAIKQVISWVKRNPTAPIRFWSQGSRGRSRYKEGDVGG